MGTLTELSSIVAAINAEPCEVKRHPEPNVSGVRIVYEDGGAGVLHPSPRALAQDYLRRLRSGTGTISADERHEYIKRLERWLEATSSAC